eukprot:scpid87892/ scgid28388/ 
MPTDKSKKSKKKKEVEPHLRICREIESHRTKGKVIKGVMIAGGIVTGAALLGAAATVPALALSHAHVAGGAAAAGVLHASSEISRSCVTSAVTNGAQQMYRCRHEIKGSALETPYKIGADAGASGNSDLVASYLISSMALASDN